MTPLDDAWDYAWYAERYHWTPDQVDKLPAWLDDRLPLIALEIDRARERAQEKARQDAERG